MKNITVALCLLVWCIATPQHIVSGLVEYTVEPLPSFYIAPEKIDPKNRPDQNAKEILSQPAYFELEFNSEESLYQSKPETMKSDSDKSSKSHFLKMFGGNGKFYCNKNDSTTVNQKFAFGETLLISYEFLEWEVQSETNVIGDFLCYKAVKKNKNNKSQATEIAWFTPEIPMSFGPSLYNGLPGLVLEVQTGKIRFIATKVSLSASQIKIQKPTEGIKMTQIEYRQKLKKIADEIGL